MPAAAGRTFLLNLGTGSPLVYAPIGGSTDNSISINGTEVDVTTMDDAGVRKLLAGAGVTSATISFNSLYLDNAGQGALTTACIARTFVALRISDTVTNTVSYTGMFQVTSIEHSGAEGDRQLFSANFASAGAITYTSA